MAIASSVELCAVGLGRTSANRERIFAGEVHVIFAGRRFGRCGQSEVEGFHG